jgi:diguanylate cyclase (GGDEF)-like protein
VRKTSRASRIRAKGDRARAARDREQATRDRELAARDREQAASDREYASTDELTGARRRGVGLEDLDNEMNRAWRQGDSLRVAYVDVDGLKSVNDTQGHAAGDALLLSVADGIRRQMRPYDLLVRLGSDEFVCAVPNITLDKLRERFDQLDAELRDSGGCSVSVGFSELREGDSSGELIKRADSDVLAGRSG